MPYGPKVHSGGLKRLPDTYYRGTAFVHWTMSLQDRATGWLDGLHHARFREWLCHTLGRHHLCCPTYCMMPDHVHLLWLGLAGKSDQRLAAALFRRAWSQELERKGYRLQSQAYDHVLREEERQPSALGKMASYVLENPVRAGLTEDWRNYPFRGAMVPGYPDLDVTEKDFWERFWRIYNRLVAR